MEFIAINLDDFHKNQNGCTTNAGMVFIAAANMRKAQELLERNYSEHPWAVVCKQIFDANIVYRGN